MSALHLDHVNIRTTRLAECIEFYGRVLGLSIRPPPMTSDLSKGAYACDERGVAIVHLVSTDNFIDAPGPVRGAAQAGMIDHFALRCSDPAIFVERMTAAGVKFTTRDVPAIGMRLIFVRDPNDVLVELGFPLGELGFPLEG
jgi:catechol 2,3-dioxygenase-like lactoylglutathione lyase family enzyme